MARKAAEKNEQANSPFVTAVHFALADTDIAQTELFDRMLGKPRDTAQEVQPVPEKAAKSKKTKLKPLRAAKPADKDAEADEPAMTMGEFASMVNSDVDFRPTQIMPQDVRAQLDAFRQDFIDSVLSAKDLNGLMKNLEGYIGKEHERLFYQTNDVMSASIKYDYFCQFMDQLCIHLREAGQLDTDQLNRIEDLEKIYKLGLNGYGLAGKKLFKATEGGTMSLLVESSRIQSNAAERPGSEGKADATPLEEHAHTIMQDLLFTNYGIKSKSKVPPPLLMTLADLTETLARSQLQAANPHLDFRDIDLASGEMMADRFSDLLDTWKERVKGNPTPQQMYSVYLDLSKQIDACQQLPETFSAMIEKAAEAAEKVAEQKMHASFKDHQLMKPTPPPRAQRMIDALHPEYNTVGTVDASLSSFKRRMRQLKKCEDKYELLEAIEEKLDLLSDEITLYGAHPAAALVAKEYMTAFRKHLGGALYDAKCHDERFLLSLKELEDKADMIHENHREIGHWLMQDTNGGHDSQFHYVLMSLGSDKTPIASSDVERIADHAAEGLSVAAEHRGIPPSLSGVQYMPLIYARCRDIAQAEMAREFEGRKRDFDRATLMQKKLDGWVSNVAATRRASSPYALYDEREPLPPQEQKLLKVSRARALTLFNQAICCLLPDDKRIEIMEASISNAESEEAPKSVTPSVKPSPETEVSKPEEAAHEGGEDEQPDYFANYPIELTAHNLRTVMNFLDHMDRQRTPMQMN
ncbi:MAG: hypothetical protein ACOYNL_06720 [Rickettsiales bacterium]